MSYIEVMGCITVFTAPGLYKSCFIYTGPHARNRFRLMVLAFPAPGLSL